MSLYTKARKHIDMNRVKKLREEKIERKKNADEIREQIREELRNINSPEFSNWRCDLDENMTTSALMTTTLPAQGDVDLGDVTSPIIGGGSSPGYSQSGNTYTSGPANAGIPPEVNGGFIIDIDTSEFDTLVFELSPGTIDSFEIIAARGGSQFTDYTLSTSAGRKVLSLKSVDRKKSVSFAFSFSQSSSGSIGTNVIRNLTFQRRTPMNVFVSLDSPEATSFIRTDPTMQGLSAEDRKKKLIDMLDAGDEYLLKYLGLIGSKARPSDVTMPDSWDQAADYGDVAVKVRPVQGPSTEVYYDKKMKQFVPRNSGGVALDQVRKAHYEPQGEVLSEKKKLKSVKDITSKIPGYYDGKPAPLGFPMQEPPKMVNGFHPDLVDGKKIANRFNRLDPQSAKAMPPTGNPHIDKKVRAAAKKPK